MESEAQQAVEAPRRRVLAVPALAVVAVVWLALGTVLADLTGRVQSWFVMTDELLYERLALSVDRLHSPLPHVHGRLIANVNQLYPLVLATVFGGGRVSSDLHAAHVLDAFLMSSTAIPVYLLARRTTGVAWASVVAAVLAVAVPWIVLSSFLLTEVVAYPAFAWGLLACQASVAAPSARRDALAVAALVLAVLARTQLGALAVVLAVGVVVAAAAEGGGARAVAARIRRDHPVLLAAAAGGMVVLVAVTATGHSPLGTYSTTANGNPVPANLLQQSLAHLAGVAVGSALLPFVVGGAWLAGNLVGAASRERQVFAWVGTAAVVALTLEVSSFDSRFGGGVVRDRYLFYIVAVLVVALACALTEARLPRLTLVVPCALLAAGLWWWPLPTFRKLNADTPASIVDNYLRRTAGGVDGARAVLLAAAVLAAIVVVEGSLLAGARRTAAVLAAAALLLMPAESAYAFVRLFRVNGTAGTPITLDQSTVFDWVDRAVGSGSHVTMIPYPSVDGDYWSSTAFWWDLEFWNESVDANAGYPGEFEGTPPTFPKTYLRFDPRTGLANVTRPGYVAQLISDARFHLAGDPVTFDRDVFLVRPDEPWRADWTTSGLYDDGWTRPHAPAQIRVYGYAGQQGGILRSLQLTLQAPGGVAARTFRLRSDVGRWSGTVGSNAVTQEFSICVPAGGAADATLTVDGSSPIYGDPTTAGSFGIPRLAGLQVTRVYLSGRVGPACRP